NKLDFSLADENGVILNDLPRGSVSFGSVEEHGIYRYVDFEEQAFKLPENADLSKIKLLASTTSYAEKISGEWKTSFVLNSITEQKSAECIINMNPWEITGVSVSPIGVTVKGHGKMYDYSDIGRLYNRVFVQQRICGKLRQQRKFRGNNYVQERIFHTCGYCGNILCFH
ncbi:MAG: hypothetical protein RR675_04800, partial [Oscillospiraceae bacterium]